MQSAAILGLLACTALLTTLACQTARQLDKKIETRLAGPMQRHPFRAFGAVGRGEPDPTREQWQTKEFAGAVQAAALAGLWDQDIAVARGAASQLREECLDVADMERYQKIVANWIFSDSRRDAVIAGDQIEFDVFKHTISNTELHSLLPRTPRFESDFRFYYLTQLHRSLAPEHLPALAKLTRHRDPHVRKQAVFGLCNVVIYSNQHRQDIADALLAWNGASNEALAAESAEEIPIYTPRMVKLAPATVTGFPPRLVACLERLLENTRDKVWPICWLERFVEAHPPSESNVALLLRLLAHEDVGAHKIALRALRHVNDKRSHERLVHFLEKGERDEQALALLALAVRGGGEWRARLASRMGDEDRMLAVAITAMPDVVIDDAIEQAKRGGPAGIDAAKRLLKAIDDCPLPVADTTIDLCVTAIQRNGQDLPASLLRLFIEDFPACRTRKIADAYLANLKTGDDLRECQLAFLEVADRGRLGQRLVELLRDEDRRDPALDCLMRLGAPEHGGALARRWPFQKDLDLFVLARSGKSRAVREMLGKRLADVRLDDADPTAEKLAPLPALGMALGLPEAFCRSWALQLDDLDSEVRRRIWPSLSKALLGDKPDDAVRAFLAAVPHNACIDNLGRVDSPAALDFLRRLRTTPGANVQWATSELAVSGDPAALGTMRIVRERHYYGWADNATGWQLLDGGRLEVAPYWINELESNCCRRIAAAQALDVCGYNALRLGEQRLETQANAARRWWRRFGKHLVFSVVAQRYEVGVVDQR